MAMRRDTTDFFSVFTKKTSSGSITSSTSNSNGTYNRSTSFLGPSGMVENLSSLHAELDNLLGETDSIDDSGIRFRASLSNKEARRLLRIRQAHWDDSSKISHCTRCRKSFNFASKKHNCRRCGKVFCDICCQYKRRLSPEAVPDPEGNFYRVCHSCADLTIQPVGEIRSLTSLFCEHRKNKRMILSDELQRLIDGFEKHVDPNSRFKTALSDTFSVMKVPEWQKSSKWIESSEVEWCSKCSSKFTLFNTKHHCRLCGAIFCGICCKANLLLYYDLQQHGMAHLIGVVGCPDKEPVVCLYLSICILCQEDLEEYQVQQYHLAQSSNTQSKSNLKEVAVVLDRLREIEKKIEVTFPRFQENVELVVFQGNRSEWTDLSGQNNVEFFAKLQGDLSDLYTEYAVAIQGLKKYGMSSKSELKIMKNMVLFKCKYYNEGMSLFKSLKDNLDKSLPAKALQQFQNFANMNAINNTFIVTRQLGFEALNLASKYKFETLLAQKISEVDQICFDELKLFVENTNEDWDEHLDALNKLLKEQLTRKKLVSPSSKLAKSDGLNYVQHLLIERSTTLLYQVLRDLKAKSSEKQFLKSKNALQELLNLVSQLNIKLGRYRSPSETR